MIARQPRAGKNGLDAATEAAIAGRPGPLLVAHPRQLVVAPFAGDGVAAGQRLPPHDDSSANAGAEDGSEHPPRPGGRAVAAEVVFVAILGTGVGAGIED